MLSFININFAVMHAYIIDSTMYMYAPTRTKLLQLTVYSLINFMNIYMYLNTKHWAISA